MFGIESLKDIIQKTEAAIECPINGCQETVARQRHKFRREERFKCPVHNIYISPSTFEYETLWENILWHDQTDKDLLNNILSVKRESRMARDNSEDAVSWNIFRFLEKERLVDDLLSSWGENQSKSEIIYWSYSQKENGSWPELNEARQEFGEEFKRSSEPDIIILADKALFFIEAKLFAGNKTTPSDNENRKRYELGGDRWFSRVFKSDYETVAIREKKYELLRFWLLGSWLANQIGKNFHLVNLVLADREADIEETFRKHIREDDRKKFIRKTWEGIYEFISAHALEGFQKEKIIKYFKNKTLGYDGNGKLRRAFNFHGSSSINDDLIKNFIRVKRKGELTEYSVCKITWDGPSKPISKWEVALRKEGEISEEHIQKDVENLLYDSRYFKACEECGVRKPIGWMHNDRICQSCAEKHGIVY